MRDQRRPVLAVPDIAAAHAGGEIAVGVIEQLRPCAVGEINPGGGMRARHIGPGRGIIVIGADPGFGGEIAVDAPVEILRVRRVFEVGGEGKPVEVVIGVVPHLARARPRIIDRDLARRVACQIDDIDIGPALAGGEPAHPPIRVGVAIGGADPVGVIDGGDLARRFVGEAEDDAGDGPQPPLRIIGPGIARRSRTRPVGIGLPAQSPRVVDARQRRVGRAVHAPALAHFIEAVVMVELDRACGIADSRQLADVEIQGAVALGIEAGGGLVIDMAGDLGLP